MSFSELLILMVIALILFGPEDLPDVARAVGRIVYEIKKMTNEVTKEFQDAVNTPANVMNKAYEEAIKPAFSEKEAQVHHAPEEELLTYDKAQDSSTQPEVQTEEQDPLAELPPDMVTYKVEEKGASR